MHLLDTSAVLAHYFRESGCEVVDRLLVCRPSDAAMCAISLVEIAARLGGLDISPREIDRVLSGYAQQAIVWPIDDAAARCAVQARRSCVDRLPTADAAIAGCAIARNATLVHRDAHFDGIPDRVLRKIRLDAPGAAPVVVREKKTPYRPKPRPRA